MFHYDFIFSNMMLKVNLSQKVNSCVVEQDEMIQKSRLHFLSPCWCCGVLPNNTRDTFYLNLQHISTNIYIHKAAYQLKEDVQNRISRHCSISGYSSQLSHVSAPQWMHDYIVTLIWIKMALEKNVSLSNYWIAACLCILSKWQICLKYHPYTLQYIRQHNVVYALVFIKRQLKNLPKKLKKHLVWV